MPRLLLLTQYFPPEIGAAQTRLFELGQELSDLGWEVEVLTALPNYPTGRVFEGYNVRNARAGSAWTAFSDSSTVASCSKRVC